MRNVSLFSSLLVQQGKSLSEGRSLLERYLVQQIGQGRREGWALISKVNENFASVKGKGNTDWYSIRTLEKVTKPKKKKKKAKKNAKNAEAEPGVRANCIPPLSLSLDSKALS